MSETRWYYAALVIVVLVVALAGGAWLLTGCSSYTYSFGVSTPCDDGTMAEQWTIKSWLVKPESWDTSIDAVLTPAEKPKGGGM